MCQHKLVFFSYWISEGGQDHLSSPAWHELVLILCSDGLQRHIESSRLFIHLDEARPAGQNVAWQEKTNAERHSIFVRLHVTDRIPGRLLCNMISI